MIVGERKHAPQVRFSSERQSFNPSVFEFPFPFRAEVHDRLSGRRQRKGLRQSRQSVGSDTQPAQRLVYLYHSMADRVRVLVGGVFHRDTQLAR